ncbi:MAG TPA: L-2-hydroxyglutarate oxidase [Chthoniobacteraceae bacterium]
MSLYDYAIIGGGIVGLSTGLAIVRKQPTAKILILEKEADWAQHQTGHNSGVIHSGIYYAPGSLKARLCAAGNRSMVEFCQEHGLPHEICGKVIVATKDEELPRLEKLYERGIANQLEVRRLVPEQVREIEPNVRCRAGIHVPGTGIVDYKRVAAKYAELAAGQGATLRTGTRVRGLREAGQTRIIETDQGDFEARFVVNCAGLHSDRVARLGGVEPGARIVPFRGEYYELVPERRSLVKALIYPVPDPAFPFLGVHFTRMIDGTVHAGPNAVLSLKREGYHKTDFNLRDFVEVMTYPGFWRLAARHAREGLREMHRSFSKQAFVQSLQELIPELRAEDVIPTHAGVRAQALAGDGRLVDDFLIVEAPGILNVCNAPSPAATASLEIGKCVAEKIPLLN